MNELIRHAMNENSLQFNLIKPIKIGFLGIHEAGGKQRGRDPPQL